MLVLPVSFGLLLHVLFWGAGLAWLVAPGRWQRFWPVFAMPAGFVLQSLVVWLGAYLNLPGTNSYALWAEMVPAILLAVAVRRSGSIRLAVEAWRFSAVYAVSALSLLALISPFIRGYHGLTTASLGSCDAADYAAGARTFMEFARSDRTGFMGLYEVTQVMSVPDFFDFWLRLNHFTPSAVIALNGSVFQCAPFEITGILCAVFLASTVPVVFWMSRSVMRLRSGWSVAVAAAYGLSPVTWYAVYHVAMGQILAAQAITLVTWVGFTLWRGRVDWRRGLAFSGVLLVAYGLILGSYNFIVLVCFVPAVAFAGGLAVWRDQWLRFVRWGVIMLVPLAVSGLVFAERVAGLAERFMLFRTYDFGWQIPLLRLDGLLGVVAGPTLLPVAAAAHWLIALLLLAVLVVAVVRGAQEGRQAVFVGFCLAVPALLGYGYLNLRGARLGTNASYDAYKLLSVFYPGILPALCYWVTLGRGRRRYQAAIPLVVAAVVAAGILQADLRFQRQMMNPPLSVSHDTVDLERVEEMPQVASVNMLIPDMWSRLWANSFLLKTPQYFLTHTYEGRLNTALKGEWDLNGSLVAVTLPGGDSIRVNASYILERKTSPYYLEARLDSGWNDLERNRAGARWSWSKGDATIRIDNPHAENLSITGSITVRSAVPRDLQIWYYDVHLATAKIGPALQTVRIPETPIQRGKTILTLRSSAPPTVASKDDGRLIDFAVHSVDLHVQESFPAVAN